MLLVLMVVLEVKMVKWQTCKMFSCHVFSSYLLVGPHVGLTLLVVVSTANFSVTSAAKASNLLGDENFRVAVAEAWRISKLRVAISRSI